MRFRDKGRTAVILASGPSAGSADLSVCEGWPVIAVNDAWRLYPGCAAIYGADFKWWTRHIETVRAGYSGECWTACPRAAKLYDLKHIEVTRRDGLSTTPGVVFAGRGVGNSGAQAINLATLWGARRLVLVGMDFYGTHFFGEHPAGLSTPDTETFKQMRSNMTMLANDLHRLGVHVVNTSAKSKLVFWPKLPLFDALSLETTAV